jgi:6-phosphogluconolactonase
VAIVTVLTDGEALAAAAAERVTALIEASIAARHGANVCLTGGQTPRRLYQQLADPSCPWRARIGWTRIDVFWGDERHVPPDHEDSNFGMAHRALLAQVPVPPAQVHRMRGELADAAEAARDYESTLQQLAELPRFDVMLLGLGEDAHIASIFPGSRLLDDVALRGASLVRLARAKASHRAGVRGGGPAESGFAPQEDLAAAVRVAHLNAWRITLTPPALLDARAIVMLVSGGTKADAVRAALDGPEDLSRWPAQLLRAAGDRVEWFIDSAAARLRGAPPS